MIFRIPREFWLFLCAGIAAGADPRWARIESPNFEIFSSAGEKSTRETLRHFEQVRNFCVQALLGGNAKPFPVRIVAFGSKKEYEPYRINEFAAAYYHPGVERDYIVLSEAGAETFPVAVHEYMHLVVRHAELNFPPWMNEGFAELYSTLKPMGDNVLVGSLVEGRRQALLMDKWVPLATILSATDDSPYYNEKNKAGSLYNEGWALMHMLSLSKEYRPGFGQFYDMVRAGTPSQEAIEKAYGKPLAAVEKDLQQYLRGDRFQGVLFPVKLMKVTDELPAAPAPAFDVKLVLADLMDRPGHEADARKRLEELALEDPKRPEPQTALGYLAWPQRNANGAREHFAKAFELGSRNPRMLWDYGRMLYRDPPRAIPVLKALLEQQPERVDVRLELASVQLSSRQAREALATIAPVKKVTSENAARLFRIMAYAQLQAGFRKEARDTADRWLSVSKTEEDRTAAQRLIDSLKDRPPASADRAAPGREARMVETPAGRPVARADTPAGDPPKLVRRDREESPVAVEPSRLSVLPSVTGSFVNFDCAGGKAKVVLQTEGGKKSFVIEDPNNIVVEGHKGGAVELTCGPQKAVRLRVVYADPPKGTAFAGSVKALYFEP